jgi:hypothetical protein
MMSGVGEEKRAKKKKALKIDFRKEGLERWERIRTSLKQSPKSALLKITMLMN